MKYKLYEVGGRIRDYYLGVESKDVDYSVVLEEPENFPSPLFAFYAFRDELVEEGYKIFLETPESFTIRAMFPEGHQHSGVADFVIARKETSYIENTRTPRVELGTLMDDLERRDFTVNAMARDVDGNIIDPFNGRADLVRKILRTPSDAAISFNNDPLRLVRALRFYITKGLSLSDEIIDAIKLFKYVDMKVVSDERIKDEFVKMFRHNTRDTLRLLSWLSTTNQMLHHTILGAFWLLPTNKK